VIAIKIEGENASPAEVRQALERLLEQFNESTDEAEEAAEPEPEELEEPPDKWVPVAIYTRLQAGALVGLMERWEFSEFTEELTAGARPGMYSYRWKRHFDDPERTLVLPLTAVTHVT